MAKTPQSRAGSIRFAVLWLGLLACAAASASLPDVEGMAARLARPETRNDTLLQMTVVARYRQRLAGGEAGLGADALAQDRAWLDRLQTRFGAARPLGPVLDPAAWQIHEKLVQQGLPAGILSAPVGAPVEVYLDRVFHRDDERLAAALLPELLWQIEPEALDHWRALLELVAADEALASSLEQGLQSWFEVEAAGPDLGDAKVLDVSAILAAAAREAVQAGPPDPGRLARLRYRLSLNAEPGLAGTAALQVANLLEGLQAARYLDFARGLLSVAGDILLSTDSGRGEVAGWLTDQLPALSAAYAREFAAVDPRINSALAAVFDAARTVAAGADGNDRGRLAGELADAVAQMALSIPDIDYYFDLPVRDTIAGGVEACLGMMAQQTAEDQPPVTRELYDDCLASLVRLADEESRTPSLSGDSNGPFGPAELRRELALTPGQRINYALGYLSQRYSTSCTLPQRALPNPLEWSSLATLQTWFAEQAPVYFQTPENEKRLQRMREIGQELLDAMAGQADCFAGSGASLGDPVTRSMADYRAALGGLARSLDESIQAFRKENLAAGADIRLEGDYRQATAYRPADVLIGPCNPEQVCDMSGQLSSTRALLGLFPEPFLLADQSGMGKVQLCYDRMEWIERRSAPVRPDDDNVANYFGHLSFDLVGRFVSDSVSRQVFGFTFTSPDEYHYLFAAASDEVLNDSCPVEWVGSRIVTTLPEDHGHIVPNRLTYLAATRMQPSRLLAQNWDRGAEWRDWFITGIGVEERKDIVPPDIGPELNEHLRAIARRELASVYDRLLNANGNGATGFSQLTDLTTQKDLVRMLMQLFYPQALEGSGTVRAALLGQSGLLDAPALARFKQDGMPVRSVRDAGQRRLEAFTVAWAQEPEASLREGSIAAGIAHSLMRLDRLYQLWFANPPPPVLPDPEPVPTPVPGAGG